MAVLVGGRLVSSAATRQRPVRGLLPCGDAHRLAVEIPAARTV
ncbi:hypothetical protein RE6C_00837 [Rhodopirellula europaea 6C]|uniref:Uncharacterized protein n=1 Tax=Rhodopirellula europaea 6C TaxID=1263867 RepID=M2A8R5_9BACT|nr:hypothetical protein RE6C_00837 [Rhodopirellula europaea 6C]